MINAAIRLFNERGVAEVSLADIAKEVGLARNSIYRYFPDTAHILAAWFRTTIEPLIHRSDAIAADFDESLSRRLHLWVLAQIEYLVHPDHSVMLVASNQLTSMPADVRTELAEGHRRLYGSLGRILSDGGLADQGRSVQLVTMLIAALIRGAAEQVRAGADVNAVRTELATAASAVASLPGTAADR